MNVTRLNGERYDDGSLKQKKETNGESRVPVVRKS